MKIVQDSASCIRPYRSASLAHFNAVLNFSTAPALALKSCAIQCVLFKKEEKNLPHMNSVVCITMRPREELTFQESNLGHGVYKMGNGKSSLVKLNAIIYGISNG